MKYKFFNYFIWLCFVYSSAEGQSGTAIKLDYFKEIPSEIDGCSGSYTYDSITLKTEKHLLAIDLRKLAFI
jgi:hypothetical protein